MPGAAGPGTVGQFKALTTYGNKQDALFLLQKIHSLVKPVMKAHGWHLPVLQEFFPKNPSLLGMNMNAGSKIFIRLRHPFSPNSFLDLDSLLHTMLHELTHNVRGPHDDIFWKTLSGLQTELESHMSKGWQGDGFFSAGHVAGGAGGSSRDVPLHEARQRALKSAEQRRKQESLLGTSASNARRTLGGVTPQPLDPREAVRVAAERREKEARQCANTLDDDERAALDNDDDVIIVSAALGATTSEPVKRSTSEPVKRSTSATKRNVIDLTASDDDDDDHVEASSSRPGASKAGASKSGAKAAPRPTATTSASTTSAIAAPPTKKLERAAKVQSWACATCTLVNDGAEILCAACGSRRKGDVTTRTWTCLACGKSDMDEQFWLCSGCGTMKLSS